MADEALENAADEQQRRLTELASVLGLEAGPDGPVGWDEVTERVREVLSLWDEAEGERGMAVERYVRALDIAWRYRELRRLALRHARALLAERDRSRRELEHRTRWATEELERRQKAERVRDAAKRMREVASRVNSQLRVELTAARAELASLQRAHAATVESHQRQTEELVYTKTQLEQSRATQLRDAKEHLAEFTAARAELNTVRQCNAANIAELHRASDMLTAANAKLERVRDELTETRRRLEWALRIVQLKEVSTDEGRAVPLREFHPLFGDAIYELPPADPETGFIDMVNPEPKPPQQPSQPEPVIDGEFPEVDEPEKRSGAEWSDADDRSLLSRGDTLLGEVNRNWPGEDWRWDVYEPSHHHGHAETEEAAKSTVERIAARPEPSALEQARREVLRLWRGGARRSSAENTSFTLQELGDAIDKWDLLEQAEAGGQS